MPIEVGIWRLGENLDRVDFKPFESEAKLASPAAGPTGSVTPPLV